MSSLLRFWQASILDSGQFYMQLHARRVYMCAHCSQRAPMSESGKRALVAGRVNSVAYSSGARIMYGG